MKNCIDLMDYFEVMGLNYLTMRIYIYYIRLVAFYEDLD